MGEHFFHITEPDGHDSASPGHSGAGPHVPPNYAATAGDVNDDGLSSGLQVAPRTRRDRQGAERRMRNLQVNGERLWASLMELPQIGATAKGGVCRLAASDLDGRRDAVDPLVRGSRLYRHRRPDRQHLCGPARPQPEAGSGHDRQPFDTQPTGGRFDGAYGVIAGLEIVRTLNDLHTRPKRRSR